jgi:NADPH-ferrihemoprotein reductase
MGPLDLLIVILVALLSFLYFSNNKNAVIPVLTATKPTLKPSITDKLLELNEDQLIVLFFGSQTGTAEELAQRCLNEFYSKLNIKGIVCDLADYDLEEDFKNWKDLELQGKKYMVGFLMATYGEGN